MAKSKPAAVETPDEGFVAFEADEVRASAPLAPPAEPGADEPDPRDAEIAALKAKVSSLEAGTPAPVPGRYRVSLTDGPTAVVECKDSEHPYEAFQRATGVRSSQHAPEIVRVPDGTPLGINRKKP